LVIIDGKIEYFLNLKFFYFNPVSYLHLMSGVTAKQAFNF